MAHCYVFDGFEKNIEVVECTAEECDLEALQEAFDDFDDCRDAAIKYLSNEINNNLALILELTQMSEDDLLDSSANEISAAVLEYRATIQRLLSESAANNINEITEE